MADRPLTPADPTELRDALSRALSRDRSGRRTKIFGDIMADAAAEHIIEALRRNNFVVMRGPSAPNHAGAPPPHSLLKQD